MEEIAWLISQSLVTTRMVSVSSFKRFLPLNRIIATEIKNDTYSHNSSYNAENGYISSSNDLELAYDQEDRNKEVPTPEYYDHYRGNFGERQRYPQPFKQSSISRSYVFDPEEHREKAQAAKRDAAIIEQDLLKISSKNFISESVY